MNHPLFVKNKICKKCGGTLYMESDYLSSDLACLQCGKRYKIKPINKPFIKGCNLPTDKEFNTFPNLNEDEEPV
jgi:DNA-directed RNA polymerase subunit M/transcription elongation factor TFIIS